MNPKIWGPYAWFFIHSIALNYPNNPTFKNRIDYSNFFKSLSNVLPCQRCAINYSNNIKNHPIDNHLDNSQQLFNWTVDIHNMVNSETGKQIISYEEAYNLHIDKYNNDDNDNLDKYKNDTQIYYKNLYENKNKNLIIIQFIIISLLVIFIICQYFYKKK